MELVTLNIRVPQVNDLEVLEVIGAGIMVLFDNHKKLGTALDDELIVDQAKLTMGDHTAEFEPCDDLRFETTFKAAEDGLNFVLAAQSEELKSLADQIKGADDIIMTEYPGVIKMYVKEGTNAHAAYRYNLSNVY